MISVFDDCLMHVHLGNVYQTYRQHEINISARLVFCLDEYFRAEPQIQAGVSMRNEALVDLTPALDMWKSDSFALIYRITVNVATLHYAAAVTQKPHTTCVDVLLFLTGNVLAFLSAFMFL